MTHRGPTVTIGDRLPSDPTPRRRIVRDLGHARPLHLGDYLGPVRDLRALAADPAVELTVRIAGTAADAARTAATLVGCGLGSAAFTLANADGEPGDAVDLTASAPPARSGVEVFDLRHPRRLMGTLPDDERGVVHLLDTPLLVAAAVRSATLDLDPTLGYDPQLRPGLANLAVILGALTDRTPIAALFGLHGAHQLKRAVTDAIETHLRPVRARYGELTADEGLMQRLVTPAG